MLYFIVTYLWSWVIVPFTFIILRPFVNLPCQLVAQHFNYNVLGIQQQITGEKLIDEGFVLPNHRSFMDFSLDFYVSNCTIVSRYLVILGAPFMLLLTYMDNRVIFINRKKDNRDDIYQKFVSHINRYKNKRIVFFPEGTRNNYTTLSSKDELKSYIKFGLLKSIYEDKRYPVQIMISNNKEIAFNEKTITANYGVKIHTKISKAIHPKDYVTEDEFFDEIVDAWFDCYAETHKNDKLQ
jgi:1-acyl-sn-glycerol-3-phosphate acyltransferase